MEKTENKKDILRKDILQKRKNEPERVRKSAEICSTLFDLPDFIQSQTVMFYVDIGSEVETRGRIPQAISLGKKVVVPYCADDDIHVLLIEKLDELTPGALGILEPTPELQRRQERRCSLDEIDLVIVPGIAFDRSGGRLGRGKGYYDRFLSALNVETHLVGLAFECQIVNSVPRLAHDILLDKVITEQAVYS